MLRGILGSAGGPPVGGSGTTNTIPRWTGATTLGDSLITQTLAGAPFEATRIRVATGVDTYAWFRDSAPSGNVLFVAANAAFSAYKNLEIASAGTYFTVGNVGVGMTSGFPAKLGVLSANAIGTADLTFSYDATGSYRHGFSNVFSSSAAGNNTSTWLVWNASGGQVQALTATGAGNVYAGSGTTGMTNGFFHIPAAAGAPTGVPSAISGRVPMYYDTTNNKFYIYNGAWKAVTLT